MQNAGSTCRWELRKCTRKSIVAAFEGSFPFNNLSLEKENPWESLEKENQVSITLQWFLYLFILLSNMIDQWINLLLR